MKLIVRKAKSADIHFFYRLANDPVVRKNSFQQNKIDFEDHSKWFSEKINNPHVLMMVVEISDTGEKVGQVRFDIDRVMQIAVISISIVEEFRGKALGSKIIDLSTVLYFSNNRYPIHAYIKRSNMASIRVFEMSGFRWYKNINNEVDESGIWILKKNHDENWT